MKELSKDSPFYKLKPREQSALRWHYDGLLEEGGYGNLTRDEIIGAAMSWFDSAARDTAFVARVLQGYEREAPWVKRPDVKCSDPALLERLFPEERVSIPIERRPRSR